jgi:ABC-2 type transport system ATP-binding protein
MPVIETINLTKKYNGFTAVNNLNLSVEEGEIFGFLGPNGAGKTTTILMLLGLTEPSSGEAYIGGFNATREPLKVKRIAGYIPEHVGFYDDLTAVENMLYTARLNGMPESVVQQRTKEAVDIVGLSDVLRNRVKTFSRGMKQRLAIADILVKEPQVAFLDEPTSGIDPKGVNEMLDLIKRIAREHKMTIVLCSHQLSQVQRICSRVGIIAQGKLELDGTLEELRSRATGAGRVMVELQLEEARPDILEAIKKIEGVESLEQSEDLLLVTCTGDLRPRIHRTIVEHDGSLVTMRLRKSELEDIYMKYFREG